MTMIVIMAGGYHPFHAGHYALYQSIVDKFPNADIYVAASDDTKIRPFPFELKKKLAKVAGVPEDKFVQVRSPFQPKEILQNYNPDEDVLVFVRSEKDRDQQPKPGGTKKDGSPAYFQPYSEKNLQSFGKHGYITYLPTVEFGPGIKSATEIRNSWPNLNKRQKLAMVLSLYPKTRENKKLAQTVVKMLDMGIGTDIIKESNMTRKIHSSNQINIIKNLGNDYYLVDDSYEDDDKFTKVWYTLYHKEGPDQYRQVGYLNVSSYSPTKEEIKQEISRLIANDKNLSEDATKEKDALSDLEHAYLHPEMQKILSYARQHYPEEPDIQGAFVKFVLRSLKHSKEDSERQEDNIEKLDSRMKSLEKKIETIMNIISSQNNKKTNEDKDYFKEK
jgi:hypothetical protein